MHLWIHTDSSYLNESKARSRGKIPAVVATSTFLTSLNYYPLNPLTQRRSKAPMDMRFYWLKDRAAQKQFHIHWKCGASNLVDYYTKHHPTKHHQEVRPTYILNATLVTTYKSWHTRHHRKGVLEPKNILLSTTPSD